MRNISLPVPISAGYQKLESCKHFFTDHEKNNINKQISDELIEENEAIDDRYEIITESAVVSEDINCDHEKQIKKCSFADQSKLKISINEQILLSAMTTTTTDKAGSIQTNISFSDSSSNPLPMCEKITKNSCGGGRKKSLTIKSLLIPFGKNGTNEPDIKMNDDEITIASSQTKEVPYSMKIDFRTISQLINNDYFQLSTDISNIVLPLLQDFIPTPSEFNSISIDTAAKHIFSHFISLDSRYCVNIQGRIRHEIQRIFADEEKFAELPELAKVFLFDAAFYEIYMLLVSDSFIRFKSSVKLKKYLKSGRIKKIPNIFRNIRERKEIFNKCTFNTSYVDLHSGFPSTL